MNRSIRKSGAAVACYRPTAGASPRPTRDRLCLQLFLIKGSDADREEDYTHRCGDDQCRGVIFNFCSRVNQGISVGQHGGQILTDLWQHSQKTGCQNCTACAQQNTGIGAENAGAQDHQRNHPQTE